MMHVKVKAKDVRLSIPVPYIFLNIAVSIVTSKVFQQNLTKWTKEPFERKQLDFSFPQLDKEMLKPVVKELKNYKGLVLVDIKAKDGTVVKVIL